MNNINIKTFWKHIHGGAVAYVTSVDGGIVLFKRADGSTGAESLSLFSQKYAEI